MSGLFYFLPYGFILQAIAIVHFIRRRPEGYWLWIIIFGGGIGALVYIVVEVIPDARLLGGTFKGLARNRRIHELRIAIQDNPSPGNYEELGGLFLEQGQFRAARESFDHAISSRADSTDAFYRRGLAELALNDLPAAIDDFQQVVMKEPTYDFHRAAALLAHAYAESGRTEQAEALFRRVTAVSTLSETQFYYALFLASQGRAVEAREWAERILAKKRSMPSFQRRRERPWFRRTTALVKQLPRERPPMAIQQK